MGKKKSQLLEMKDVHPNDAKHDKAFLTSKSKKNKLGYNPGDAYRSNKDQQRSS